MIAEKMKNMVANSSAIRAMFEEGNRMAELYGAENVYDFSLGNPNVPAPEAVKNAIIELVSESDPVVLHGYTNSNSGYADVRETVATSLNERFGTNFSGNNIVMTVGAAGGLNVILKSLINPGDEVIAFAPYFGEYRSYTNNYDGVLVEIQSVGAGAVNQAVKAIAISRGFLSPVGIEIACIPSFADIVIDGEYRTAIRFTVEPRSVRDRVAGASGVSAEE